MSEIFDISCIITLTVDQSQLCRPIFVGKNRDHRLSIGRSGFRAPHLVDFLVQFRDPLVQIPDCLCASKDLVIQRIGEGIGLIRGEMRVVGHVLPIRFQDLDLLLARAFLSLEFNKLGFEVSDGVRFRDLRTSIEGALNDEELSVSESIYPEGFRLGDAAEIFNFNHVGSCLSNEDAIGFENTSRTHLNHGAHLEINVELPDDLCSGRTIDSDSLDR